MSVFGLCLLINDSGLPALVKLLCIGLILLPFQCHERLNVTRQIEIPNMTYCMRFLQTFTKR